MKRRFQARALDLEIMDLLARTAQLPSRSTSIMGALPHRNGKDIRNALNRMRRHTILKTVRAYNWTLDELGWEVLKTIAPPRCEHCNRPFEKVGP